MGKCELLMYIYEFEVKIKLHGLHNMKNTARKSLHTSSNARIIAGISVRMKEQDSVQKEFIKARCTTN